MRRTLALVNPNKTHSRHRKSTAKSVQDAAEEQMAINSVKNLNHSLPCTRISWDNSKWPESLEESFLVPFDKQDTPEWDSIAGPVLGLKKVVRFNKRYLKTGRIGHTMNTKSITCGNYFFNHYLLPKVLTESKEAKPDVDIKWSKDKQSCLISLHSLDSYILIFGKSNFFQSFKYGSRALVFPKGVAISDWCAVETSNSESESYPKISVNKGDIVGIMEKLDDFYLVHRNNPSISVNFLGTVVVGECGLLPTSEIDVIDPINIRWNKKKQILTVKIPFFAWNHCGNPLHPIA